MHKLVSNWFLPGSYRSYGSDCSYQLHEVSYYVHMHMHCSKIDLKMFKRFKVVQYILSPNFQCSFVKVWWEDVQCTAPPWTYLNIFNPILEQCMCRSRKPCEVRRNNLNHRIGRNQAGTSLETSLCMEELGDGFSFVFVGCGVFGCCLTHVLGTWCELDAW